MRIRIGVANTKKKQKKHQQQQQERREKAHSVARTRRRADKCNALTSVLCGFTPNQ